MFNFFRKNKNSNDIDPFKFAEQVEEAREEARRKSTPSEILQTLENIRKYSEAGKRAVEWAETTGLGYILLEEKREMYGVYYPVGKTYSHEIGINLPLCKKNNHSVEAVLAHELMHVIQIQSTVIKTNQNMNLISRIHANHALEAGAEAFALRVFHEMKQNGFKTSAKPYGKNSKFLKGHELLERRFREAYDLAEKSGESEDASVFEATNAVFQSYMTECQAFYYSYGVRGVLRSYMDDIVNGRLAKDSFFTGKETIRKNSMLSEGEYLAKPIGDLPMTFEELFGGNLRMAQLMEYVEAFRTLGRVSKTNLQHNFIRAQLADDSNPFLGVDLNEALEIWKAQDDLPKDDRKGIKTIMLELAGYDETKQLRFQFLADAEQDDKADKSAMPSLRTLSSVMRI